MSTDVLRNIITQIIGSYQPNANVVDGNLVYLDGAAGVDWVWIMSALLFLLVIWSVFRLIGVLFRK